MVTSGLHVAAHASTLPIWRQAPVAVVGERRVVSARAFPGVLCAQFGTSFDIKMAY